MATTKSTSGARGRPLSDRELESIKPTGTRYEELEPGSNGFGVRVSSTGVVTFIYRYLFEARPRKMTLGQYPAVSLKEARKRHSVARAKLLSDPPVDPGQEQVERKRAQRAADTIEGLSSLTCLAGSSPARRRTPSTGASSMPSCTQSGSSARQTPLPRPKLSPCWIESATVRPRWPTEHSS